MYPTEVYILIYPTFKYWMYPTFYFNVPPFIQIDIPLYTNYNTSQLKGLEDCAGVLPDSSLKAGVCHVRAHYLPSEQGRAQHKKVPCFFLFFLIFLLFFVIFYILLFFIFSLPYN